MSVACEICSRAHGLIGWVKVDEVTFRGVLRGFLIVGRQQLCICIVKDSTYCSQVLFIENSRIFIFPKWDIELTFPVDSIQPVVTGLVKENKTGCLLNATEGSLLSDLIIVFFR